MQLRIFHTVAQRAVLKLTRINYPSGELRALTRRYTFAIAPIIGADSDIPAPDVNTNAQTMAWVLDTYSQLQGKPCPGVVTGKPIELGGSRGRNSATGRGVVISTKLLLAKEGKKLDDIKSSDSGYGKCRKQCRKNFPAQGKQSCGNQ